MIYFWSSLMKQGKRILKCRFMLICKGVSLLYKKQICWQLLLILLKYLYISETWQSCFDNKNRFLVLKTSMEPFLVGLGAAMWGSEPLMWGSEVSFANNGVRRSEMWGSPSLPHLRVQRFRHLSLFYYLFIFSLTLCMSMNLYSHLELFCWERSSSICPSWVCQFQHR